MDQVEYHLKLVINLWCGAVPSQYNADSQLRDIYAAQVPNLDYDTFGVPQLLTQIYRDAVFGSCPAAQDLTSAEFITGGGIQTFGNLFLQLDGCAANSTLAKVTGPLKRKSPAKQPTN